MIDETLAEITQTHKQWQVEMDSRYARRNKIRYTDRLLNALELTNLAERAEPDPKLRRELVVFLGACKHPLSQTPPTRITVAAGMEALYEIQDSLLLGSEDEDERR